MTRSQLLGTALFAAMAAGVAGQSPYAPDVPEPGSVETIATLTTDPRFVNPWVAYVPASDDVPSPGDYLGRIAGAAGELARTAEIYGYFRELARTSPRVQVQTIGRTEEGRDILLVAVADEEGIRRLEELKRATAALADPRETDPETANHIIESARPIYYFNAGLHADETGSPETMMELAYRLAVSEWSMIREIRERVLVLINPVSEPDGRDKMVDWFYRYLKGRTDYNRLPRQSPPYWNSYVYVDINRDAHQQALEVTRAVHRMFHEFHPTVVHDLHEAIPYLLTWNGTGPYNPNLDPIVLSEFLEMSFHEMTALSGLGMPGVWTWRFGEGFGHHYLDSVAMNHNSIGRGYETFGNATAETVDRSINEESTTREWYRPWPPDPTVRWSMRNTVNYIQSGCLAILSYTARHGKELLRNFYRKGYNSWQKGLQEPPYAFVIPADQGDRGRVAALVNLLLAQRIEVGRLTAPVIFQEGPFPSGAFIVQLDQPYRNYAVDLLTPQEFPADAEHEPYDDISWALPVHYGLDVVPIGDPAVKSIAPQPIEREVRPSGRVDGGGAAFLLRDTGQEALLAARFRLSEFRVEIAERSFAVAGRRYPAGSWILPDQPGLRAALESVASELALDFDGIAAMPDAPRHEAPAPRIGIWVPWADTDSIGWIRYTLDRRRVPYTYLRDEEIRAGGLKQLVDVIVYGHVRLAVTSQVHGLPRTAAPMPFTQTADYPSHGVPAASPDITGGIGWTGMANLQRFVEDGGVLVTLGNGSALALDTGLVPNIKRATGGAISTPGVELRVTFTRPDHPLAYGYSDRPSAFRSNYPVYDVPVRWLEMSYCTSCLEGPLDRRWIVMTWGTDPGDEPSAGAGDALPVVLSGGARGIDHLVGKPAVFDVPLGRGHVVAFNFNPMHRDLNRSDYRFLWNVILNWNRLAPILAP